MCAESANDLSAHVKISIDACRQMEEAKHCGLFPSISAAKRILPAISALAQKLDKYDEHFELTRSIVRRDARPKLQIGLATKLHLGSVSHEHNVTHKVVEPQPPRDEQVPPSQEDQDENVGAVKAEFDVDELLRIWTVPEA
jgi:hypothetical protein